MRFAIFEFEGKEAYLRQTLSAKGHEPAARIDETDLLLVDTDAGWAYPRPAMIEAAAAAGAKVVLYPHGGMPCCWQYDGIATPDPRVDLRLEHGPGSIEVAESFGADLKQAAPGWLFSPTRPFKPVKKPRRVLFAPLHPIIEGLGMPMNGHDPAPAWNQRVYRALLGLGYQVVVSLVGPPHRNGIWPHPRANLVENPQMSFPASYEQVMAADLVVAAGTVGALGVACGKPTVMFGQDNWQDYVNGEYPQAEHPELYRDLIRYPLDADGDLGETILRACAGSPEVDEWRAAYIGDDGTAAAIGLLEKLVNKPVRKPKTEHVVIGGVTARATGR